MRKCSPSGWQYRYCPSDLDASSLRRRLRGRTPVMGVGSIVIPLMREPLVCRQINHRVRSVSHFVSSQVKSTVNRAPWFRSPRPILNSPPIRWTKDRIILIPSPREQAGSNPSGRTGPSLDTDSAYHFANPSPPSGWVGDFHPQATEHAQHTTNPLAGARAARGGVVPRGEAAASSIEIAE